MWRNFSYKRITDLDRLRLLLWKNYLLMLRTKSKILTLILVPLLFPTVFICVRLIMVDDQVDHRTYDSLPVLHTPKRYTNQSHLAFVANDFKDAEYLMNDIEGLLFLNKSMEFFTEHDLEEYLLGNQSHPVGGILFNHKVNTLVAVIRVAGLDSQHSSTDHWWHTDRLYPIMVEVGSRFEDKNDGGPVPGYVQSGFIAIQSALSMAYLKRMGKLDKLPEIQLKRFPHPPYPRQNSLHANKIVLQAGTIIGFYFVCLYNVKSIVLEKEMQFKEAMKMMGLGDFLHWCAWFIEFLAIFLLMAVIIIIGWKFGHIFEYSQVGMLLLVYFVYALAFATFCFLLSSIFCKSATATATTLLLWCASFIPYFLTFRQSTTRPVKYLSGLCLNTAMFYFIDILYNREALQQGVRAANFYDPVWFEDNISVADCVQMLAIDFLIYAIVAWYMNKVFPGQYGVPAKWYFPFAGLCKFSVEPRPVYGTFEAGDNFEKGPEGKLAAIKIIALTKIYTNATVGLDGVTMDVFDNEITVLLGENGAGKSTLLSVLTGLYPPTNGTALVNDFDIRTHMDLIHESLGVCPQHNILFDALTVEEHLLFFSKLKGCPSAEARYEATKYIQQLDMKETADEVVKTLPMGMKRRLCLAIALCGDSKVVLADEPTAGMDPVARKAVWDLLQVEKATRIIILSTNIMEEADVLADRVAILQSGKLKCYGTPGFLKTLYGGAKFKLTCEKNEGSDIAGIEALVKRHDPTATISLNMASELSYKLDNTFLLKFPALLKEIEENASKLGLQGYGISLTGMEEVFFRVLLDNPEYTLITQDQQRQRIANATEGLRDGQDPVTLLRSQILGLLLKKFFYAKYHWPVMFVQLIIPPFLIFLVLHTITDPLQKFRVEPLFNVSLDSYLNDPICVMTPPKSSLAQAYAFPFSDPPLARALEVEENISEFFLNQVKAEDVPFMRMRYLVGASLNEAPLIAWFNNQPYHTIPLTVQMLFSAMLRVACNNCSLNIINHPLPEFKGTRQDVNDSKLQDVISDVVIVVIFDLAMFIMVAYFVIDCVKEQRSRLKLMQYISGTSPLVYWLMTMLADVILLWIAVGLTIGVYLMEVDVNTACLNLAVVLMAYSFSVLPFVYMRALRYSSPTAAYLNILMLGIILGTLAQFGWSKGAPLIPWMDGYLRNVTEVALQANPFFNLASGTDHVWMSHDSSKSDWDFSANSRMTRSLIIFFGTGVFFFIFLLVNECNFWRWLGYAVSFRSVGTTNDASMDVDVIKEREFVGAMGPSNIGLFNLVCHKLCKAYDDLLAVDDLSFTIEGSRCFGLLGVNGAGKTTFFKMLTGETAVTSGDGWVRGLSLKNDMRSIYLEIGYCPQEEALPEELTGRESLKMFCLLKGVSTDVVDQVSLEIAHNLGFLSHIDKKVKEMSGGNRRKLSVALAMLNKPRLLLMDEPTSGLDPSAKRQMWRMISGHREFGKSILLSSQSMEECEVLCTRLAIMVNGQLRCIGTTQHLKTRFADGYLLVVQINRTRASLMVPGSESKIRRTEEYINNAFPGAALKEKYQGRLYYHIPYSRGVQWSTIFTKLESNRGALDIESYNIRQLGLDHVFRKFVQSQLQDARLGEADM